MRNGIFDSVFFGMQHYFAESYECSAAASYGGAAATAVVVDYSVDMALKRMMKQPPHVAVDGILATLRGVVKGLSPVQAVALIHRGLSPKVVEFSVNYSVIGVTSVYVYNFFHLDGPQKK
jgi:hypothetical protein